MKEKLYEEAIPFWPTHLLNLKPNEKVTKEIIRFRTIGDLTITGAVESKASTLITLLRGCCSAGNRTRKPRR